jgi:hypothetical protein
VQIDFAAACAWLDDHLGHAVFASTQGAAPDAGNSRLSVQGTLDRAEGDIMLVEPRPGRIEAFTIGPATLVLLEGDFTTAQVGALEGGAMLLQAEFRDLLVVVGTVPGRAADG